MQSLGRRYFEDGIHFPTVVNSAEGIADRTSASIITNEGAEDTEQYSLPEDANIGSMFTFLVVEEQLLEISTADTMQVAEVSGTLASSSTPGSSITLVCVASGIWTATSLVGPWDVTTP